MRAILTFAITLVVSGCTDGFADNYKKVSIGMSQQDVQKVLGGPGAELKREHLPQIVDRSVPGNPKLTPIVKGKTFLKWTRAQSYIIIAFDEDKVVDKTLYIPSL